MKERFHELLNDFITKKKKNIPHFQYKYTIIKFQKEHAFWLYKKLSIIS